jgi:predicted enzyme related to lactoylglutathione lyase
VWGWRNGTTAANIKASEREDADDGRAVSGLAMALVAVPSLGPVRKAWQRLGFKVTEIGGFLGCPAFEVRLAGTGVRFVTPPRDPAATALGSVVADRLVAGSGLLGWSWACADVDRSRQVIEKRSGRSFPINHKGAKTFVVPPALNPGAVTTLEAGNKNHAPTHPNGITRLDHLVVTVSDADAATGAYKRNFGLTPQAKTMKKRRYSFLKVGNSVVEIVGPAPPEPGPPTGRPWGLAFHCPDLDATVTNIRSAGVDIADPYPAHQGGRITKLSMQLGGVQIAFMGN